MPRERRGEDVHRAGGDRRLVACLACERQYDASERTVGEQFHCACGEVLSVPADRPHEARIVRCTSCGAPRGAGAHDSGFCGADFTLHERDLHTICPRCMARISDRARYCPQCATLIAPEASAGSHTEHLCPACGEASRLVSRSLGGERLSVLECGRCAGLWLGNEVFSHLEESSQEQAAAGDAGPPLSARTAAAERRPDLETVRYRPCPVCTQLMHRRNYGRRSGVVFDTCWTHGRWFDQGELDSILDWLRRGGLARARRWDRQLAVEEERVRAFGRDDRAPHVWPDRDVATSRSPLADFLGGVLSFPGTRV